MTTISYKAKSKLIDELLKKDDIKLLEKQSLFSKIGFSKKEEADLYFHNGALDKEAIFSINASKKTIVNSQMLAKEVLKKIPEAKEKLELIYPAVDLIYQNPKEIKKQVCEKLGIDSKKKIIFFTAQNLKANGVLDFINIIMQLNSQNIISIIASDKKQIFNLKFQLSKLDLEGKLLLLEDYKNMDELFLASDVFLLPTYNNNFAVNILKAMYCKCVVFTTVNNASKELIDTFSTMESPNDRSIIFKINAILQNKDDLKLIKNQNRKIAKNYTLEKQMQKIEAVIASF